MSYNRECHAAYRQKHAGTIARYQAAYYSGSKARHGADQQWIARARLALGWSQAGLARSVGVSQATISKLETGALALDGFRGKDKLMAVLGVTA